MPLFWIFYRNNDRPAGVVIKDAANLGDARMLAKRDGFETGVIFAEGHMLDAELSTMVAPEEIGRFLLLPEANLIIKRFEAAASAKPAARPQNEVAPVHAGQSPPRTAASGRAPAKWFFERTRDGYVVCDAERREALRVVVNFATPKMLGYRK